jgi:site-specific DNA recombinase
MNVICYKRVSTDEQADRGVSLQNQEDILLRYCQLKNYNVVQIYTEDFSGKNFERPEWRRLMEYCNTHKGKVNLILTTKWDRWSRNHYDAMTQIKLLGKMGIVVDTVEQPLDLTNPDNKVLLALYLTIPEVENDKNSMRTTECSRKARMMGCWTGTSPRGYNNFRSEIDKRSTLIPSKDAHLIVEAFEKMASGLCSADEVRKYMNSKGLKISKNQFLNIIRNVVYTGRIWVKQFKDQPETIVTGIHPPLVSDELFAAANQVLSGRKRKMVFKKDKSELYPLKGHLKCSVHNLSLTGGKSKGRYGVYHYYLCTYKHKACKRYPVDLIHSLIEEKLKEIQFGAGVISSYKSVLTKMFEVEDADRLKSIKHLNLELEKLEGQKSVLQTNFLNQTIEVKEYREMKQMIDSKVFEVNSKLTEFGNQISPIKDYLNNHVPMMENILDYYLKSDGKTKNKILSCILSEKISFDENKDAAISFTTPVSILINAGKGLKKGRKEKEVRNDLLSYMAPPSGLEPETL